MTGYAAAGRVFCDECPKSPFDSAISLHDNPRSQQIDAGVDVPGMREDVALLSERAQYLD